MRGGRDVLACRHYTRVAAWGSGRTVNRVEEDLDKRVCVYCGIISSEVCLLYYTVLVTAAYSEMVRGLSAEINDVTQNSLPGEDLQHHCYL